MIYSPIEDAQNYSGRGEGFLWAVSQLQQENIADLPPGKTELIPGKAWLNIEEPQALPAEEGPFEAHRGFVDLQMTLRGRALIGWAPVKRLKPMIPYSEEEDIAYYSGSGMMLDCTRGMFALFFPEDAHQPCVSATGTPERVKKAVVKIHRSLIAKK